MGIGEKIMTKFNKNEMICYSLAVLHNAIDEETDDEADKNVKKVMQTAWHAVRKLVNGERINDREIDILCGLLCISENQKLEIEEAMMPVPKKKFFNDDDS